mmetsp:Transcript_109858/g.317613  ORF Transcript_109858/g.317613 Transcript_109858/m.317613 type:complete len:274 (+) Transcript_109858:1570-2391(+)
MLRAVRDRLHCWPQRTRADDNRRRQGLYEGHRENTLAAGHEVGKGRDLGRRARLADKRNVRHSPAQHSADAPRDIACVFREYHPPDVGRSLAHQGGRRRRKFLERSEGWMHGHRGSRPGGGLGNSGVFHCVDRREVPRRAFPGKRRASGSAQVDGEEGRASAQGAGAEVLGALGPLPQGGIARRRLDAASRRLRHCCGLRVVRADVLPQVPDHRPDRRAAGGRRLGWQCRKHCDFPRRRCYLGVDDLRVRHPYCTCGRHVPAREGRAVPAREG